MCSEFLNSRRIQKARRAYQCAANCGVPIMAGKPYVRTSELSGGGWIHTHWHEACRDEFDKTLIEHHEDCGDPDLTWENGMPPEAKHQYLGGV